ncbi:phage tail protein [Roseibium suaedae]|uniref:Microcystin-dependent protein n=1 Tax=Roseibium suaedae TaxID=735517 RepID=A0A1M7KGR9_9HYPH|nr:tail fiber protein [Roseibium suaedae]SHM64482.1 Microcystin-dependent protein [Roseibium suaedae]
MSEPFLAEIRMVGFDFAPRGWSFTDGQILPIAQNQSLYSLLGTIYGGDGRTTFALPDLRGRTPIHRGISEPLGYKAGVETVTLSIDEIPEHRHEIYAQDQPGNNRSPAGRYLGMPASASNGTYSDGSELLETTLLSGTISNTGGSQAHDNMQPYLAVSFCIALQGLFPSRN